MKKRLLFPLIVVLFLLALCPVALASSNDISLPEYGLTLTLPDGYYLVTREGISEKIPEQQEAFFTAQYEALLQGTEIFYASAGEGGPSWSCGYIEDAESGRKPYTKMMQGELEEELDRVAAGGEVLDISEYVTDNFAFLRFFIDEGDAQSMHYRTIVLGHEYELVYRAEGEMSARDQERTEWLIDTVSFMPVGGMQESEGEPEAEAFEPEVYNPVPQDMPAQTADPGFSPRESAAAKQATLSYYLVLMLISAGVVLAVIGRVLYKYGKDKRTAALPVGRITEAERINRLLSRLEELRNRGIISEAEFAQKQQELLARGSRGR